MTTRMNLLLLSLSFTNLTYAFYSEEQILNEFQNKKMGLSTLDTFKRAPASTAQFFNPPLDEVIPKDTQEKLEKKLKKNFTNFSGVHDSVDLRHRDSEVVSQIGPRCSAYGLVASMENLLGHPNYATISRNHLWSLYGIYSSEAAVDAAKRSSLTEEEMWPHDQKKPTTGWQERAHTKLTHISYIDNNIEKAVRALDAGRPVYLGASVTKSWGNCDVVMDPNSSNTGGGHAVTISGYKLDKNIPGGGYFIIKNSWGADCGDQGYQYFPFNYCMRGNGSYCIMWDVQGVQTDFAGVADVEPDFELFNLNKIQVDVTSYKKWYQTKRRVNVHLYGESVHTQQIRDVIVQVDNGIESQVAMDIDEMKYSFKTKKKTHTINLYIQLKSGESVVKTVTWVR